MAYYFNTDKQDVPFIVERGDDSQYIVLNNEGLIRSTNSNYYPIRPISLYNLTPEPITEYKRTEPVKQESSRSFFDVDYYDLDFGDEPIDTSSIVAAEYETPPEPISAEETENISALGDELEALLTREKVHFRFTSKKRKPGLAGRAGSRSWHVRGFAWDIVPNGVSWAQLKREIYGNPRIIAWLLTPRRVNGVMRTLGILDETNPETKRKTGATGDHLHIGFDTIAVNELKKYIKNPHLWRYEKGGRIKINNYTDSIITPSLFQQKPMIKVNRTGGILRMALGQQFPLNTAPDSLDVNYLYNDSTIDGRNLGVEYMSENGVPVFSLNTPGPKKTWFEKHNPIKRPEIQASKYITDYIKEDDIPQEFVDKLNSFLPYKRFEKENILNALKTIDYLVNDGGFSIVLAAAQAGTFLDENECRAHSTNEREQNNRGTPFTKGKNRYGAGIASLTGDTKILYLRICGMPLDTKIEELSLKEQCDMISKVANTERIQYTENGKTKTCVNYLYKPFQQLKKATNLENSASSAFFITAGHNGWSNWDTQPTAEAAAKRAEVLSARNIRNNGGRKSAYLSNNMYVRRKAYGEVMLNLVKYYYDNYNKNGRI